MSIERVVDLATNSTNEDLLEPIDRHVEQYAYWEQQIDALLSLLRRKGVMNVHQLRQGVESIDKELYNKLSYYERWAISIAKHCLESGVLTQDDLNQTYGPPLHSTDEQLFQLGDRVRVHHENYATRWIKPHLRTPGYLYGKIGTIVKCCGSYPNPEYFAYDNTDENASHQQPLYRVRFNQKSIWDHYEGNENDTIDVEIYQHWLMAASETEPLIEEHCHELALDHKHDDHEHDHIHEARATVEQTAVDREGNPLPVQHLAESLVGALINKKIITSEELRKQIETNQMAGIEQRGANIVVEAWLNPEFKERLLNESTKTIAEYLKFDKVVNDFMVVENTDQTHNLIVCTLCSCYPRQLLGLPPGWYKSRSYRIRAPREPRAVLKEFGTILPENMKIQVHDSTADLRYLVIPRRPPATQNWSREQLLSIVTRDSMIGVCDITV